MQLDHFKVKIFSDTPDSLVVDDAIPIFHRWIQQDALKDSILVDVVDYAHVPLGPGVMLVGHSDLYSVETGSHNKPGLVYSSKVSKSETTSGRLAEAVAKALQATRLLADEAEWQRRVSFKSKEFQVSVNDRILAPNTRDTFNDNKVELEKGLLEALGHNNFNLDYHVADSRELFCVNVKLDQPLS